MIHAHISKCLLRVFGFQFLIVMFLSGNLLSQIVTLTPILANAEQAVVLTFDANLGNAELANASKVYMHHGIVTSGPTGTAWQNVIGNWGQDDGVGEMMAVPNEPGKWQINFTPTLREYFGVAQGTNIFRISAVFRSADGATKGTIAAGNYPFGNVTASGDFYINLNVPNYITFSAPTATESFLSAGQTVNITANTSSSATDLKILLDHGTGFEEVAALTSGNSISYVYTPTQAEFLQIKVQATINGELIETQKSHQLILYQTNLTAALPSGVVPGINYNSNDASKVTLVLQAPGKTYVYAVGDFSNWQALPQNQMFKTPDGEYFWIELSNLTPQQAYVFQYWVNGNVKIGDPYADQVADPWNDSSIEPEVYPNLPIYTRQDFGIATVFKTGQTPYNWAATEQTYQRPPVDNLVIYELHIRDFLASHSYNDLIDTLQYLKRLGIDAIELMPVNEFEGNDSWGYNPSYYFAPDKYYGTKEDLKRFVETAHAIGLPVILDIVLNHAFSQCALVKLYFNTSTGKPTPDNPWFNVNTVGPYAWGSDFNHESQYTKDFIDRVNKYWITEFHIDGYRFDFTKGFTNYAPGGNIDGFDQSRINILKRMADAIRVVDQNAYIILEHWGGAPEELILGNYGMKMWSNRSYDINPTTCGNIQGSFNNMSDNQHVAFFDSHDEQRLAKVVLSDGRMNGSYNIKDKLVMYERVKMAAAFTFLYPGPKMIWQFDELGYDIDINFNGRVGRKPSPWGANGLGYYEDSLRQYIYKTYEGILDIRHQLDAAQLATATTNHKTSGNTRRLLYNTNATDLIVIGNFGMAAEPIAPLFTQTGTWYDYFSGDSISVTDVNATVNLAAGQWHIYTTIRLSEGLPLTVEVFDNPVTITPFPFKKGDAITVRFDATKAWKGNTAGLVGANEVYFHSGTVVNHPDSTTLTNVVGTLQADGIGAMTEVSNDIWEISFTPSSYYNVADLEVFKLGMYFRDAANENLGLGYRNSTIYFNVESDLPLITVNPTAYANYNTITVTFNARAGNRELMGASKVYMHSSVGLIETTTPQNSAWNNAVGNWGQDDGVGRMTAVAGEVDKWEITLIPRDYYGLQENEFPYWLAAVFRSADGNTKGTGSLGLIENGFIADNQDIFVKNQGFVGIEEQVIQQQLIYPNPTNGILYLKNITAFERFAIFDAVGKLKLNVNNNAQTIDVSNFSSGIYFYQLETKHGIFNGKILKN